MGVDGLRALIEGGLPRQTVVLLNGPPGVGKSTLATQLLIENLSAGGAGLVVTTEQSPTQVLDRANPHPLRPYAGPDGTLWVLDAYSWRTGTPSGEPCVAASAAPTDLLNLSIRFSEALRVAARTNLPLVVVFDTPSTLAFHASTPSMLKFLEVCFAKAKEVDACLLVPLEKGVHDEQLVAALSYMCEGVLELNFDESNMEMTRFVRVRAMRTAKKYSNRWVRLLVDGDEVSLGEPRAPPAAEPGATKPA